jgi:hypothetical protein
MSINIVPEHALPKSFFFEQELSSSGRRIAFEPARTRRPELSDRSSPACEAVGAELAPPDQSRAITLIN